MNAAEQVAKELAEVLAPMDAEVLAATQEWAQRRVNALKEFKTSEEYSRIQSNAFAKHERLFAIAGGKGWYKIFDGRNADMIATAVAKECAATAAARNASITKKLVKAGVTEVISREFTYTNDGFNGCFVVGTDNGKKVVRIETIRAGGYNIQCLHLRVLVKVK